MPSLTKSVLDGPSRLQKFFSKLGDPLWEMLVHEWYLGFTSFGGPGVHFQIFRKKFVDELEWLDDQTYKEMFAICQSLSGPGSTKMLYAINVMRSGFTVGLLSFLVWSLPGALGAYGLAVGISKISNVLPLPVYALLSGLNAAIVGIIALAAVQLSRKAITDKLTRVLVFLGGTAGMLYNALWYIPLLMIAGGTATILWDSRLIQESSRMIRKVTLRRNQETITSEEDAPTDVTEMQDVSQTSRSNPKSSTDDNTTRRTGTRSTQPVSLTPATLNETLSATDTSGTRSLVWSWKFGTTVIMVFFVTFISTMVLRGSLHNAPLGFRLFANLYLAGTIIFGGGPVVIPLLRDYVVYEGWVSPRDFLLGLAIIQAFPGPNFNFAVYLGALAGSEFGINAASGAVIAYIAIFLPGIALHTGVMGIWKVIRQYRWVISGLRGINATAVGLIYAAVYRLWEIGFLSEKFQGGASLGGDPWWVVVTATSFVGGMWFNISPPVAIVMGGGMGMIWYGVVS